MRTSGVPRSNATWGSHVEGSETCHLRRQSRHLSGADLVLSPFFALSLSPSLPLSLCLSLWLPASLSLSRPPRASLRHSYFGAGPPGIQAACGRMGSIASSLIFGLFTDSNPEIPMLTTGVTLLLSSLCAIGLPNTGTGTVMH